MSNQHEMFNISALVVIDSGVVLAGNLLLLALADGLFLCLWVIDALNQVRKLPRQTVPGFLEVIRNFLLRIGWLRSCSWRRRRAPLQRGG